MKKESSNTDREGETEEKERKRGRRPA